MKPSPSYALIIEDQKEEVSKSGLILSHQNKNGNGIGTVYDINGIVLCPHCIGKHERNDIKKGDKVVFSKFIAENIDYKTQDMPEGRLLSVPIDAILAIISSN